MNMMNTRLGHGDRPRRQWTYAKVVGHLLLREVRLADPEFDDRVAFDRLDGVGAFGSSPPTSDQLIAWLQDPVWLYETSRRHCRLSPHWATVLANALAAMAQAPDTGEGRPVRDWLATVPGFDITMASWAVKYLFEPDCIAIVDPHTLHNGQLMGLFPLDASIPRDYLALEKALLRFCDALDVLPWEFSWSLLQDHVDDLPKVAQQVEALKKASACRASAGKGSIEASHPKGKRRARAKIVEKKGE